METCKGQFGGPPGPPPSDDMADNGNTPPPRGGPHHHHGPHGHHGHHGHHHHVNYSLIHTFFNSLVTFFVASVVSSASPPVFLTKLEF